jgi:hypothetical protein
MTSYLDGKLLSVEDHLEPRHLSLGSKLIIFGLCTPSRTLSDPAVASHISHCALLLHPVCSASASSAQLLLPSAWESMTFLLLRPGVDDVSAFASELQSPSPCS